VSSILGARDRSIPDCGALHQLVYVQQRFVDPQFWFAAGYRRPALPTAIGLGRGANAGTATKARRDHEVERDVELFVLRFCFLVCFLQGLLTNPGTLSGF
jgi:hypothetical protein